MMRNYLKLAKKLGTKETRIFECRYQTGGQVLDSLDY